MTLSFYVISSQRQFSNCKNSGIREEVSDVNKSLCEKILFVSSRLCTSPLVRAPPQLTLFTSPTTPSTPRHMRGRQFSTLEIWQSPDKFTGKRRIQIYVYVYIYIRSLFRLARLGWRRPPSRWTPPFRRRRGYQWDSQYGSEAETGRVDDILSRREFSNRKNSGVREEVSDVKKSLCKNILFVSSRLCTSPLVRAPPQLTLFTSAITPSTPRHMRGRQFSTLEIWHSPDKFTGKRITQIYVYVCIYMRSLFQSARLGWRRPPSRWTPPFRRRRGYQWDSQYGSESETVRVDDILLR